MRGSGYQEFAALPEGWSFGKFAEGRAVKDAPYRWSGKSAPPAIGAEVVVRMNGLGVAIVKGYFVEDEWLGVLVELKSPPDWWLKQNAKALANGHVHSHIFGAELAQ